MSLYMIDDGVKLKCFVTFAGKHKANTLIQNLSSMRPQFLLIMQSYQSLMEVYMSKIW